MNFLLLTPDSFLFHKVGILDSFICFYLIIYWGEALISLKNYSLKLFIFILIPFALVAGSQFVLSNKSYAGYASIIVDADNGRVLRSRNADTRNFPASLTKIMTLYMTFEALETGRLKMNSRLKVSKRAEGQTPSKLGLKRGDTISVKHSILALVTKSANDVATVLAEALGGTEWEFAQKMTLRARSLGMKKTTFLNASGLPNRRQLSTARDMATLAVAIYNDFPQYYHFFSSKNFRFRGIKHKNHNNLLGFYRGVDGIKTGYTRSSGFNLVASAERSGRRIIAVVFGGKTAKRRDGHMKDLLDKGFSRIVEYDRERKLSKVAQVPLPHFRPLSQGAKTLKETDQILDKDKTILTRLEGHWAIQVGAFRNENSASRILRRAGRVAAQTLENGVATVTSVTLKNGIVLYRARFSGLKLLSAKRACVALKVSEIPCVVVRLERSEIYISLK
tara:strand:- start:42 stop:1388 length:1347 start_codon:yes stop_codon:yes gene_type:complete